MQDTLRGSIDPAALGGYLAARGRGALAKAAPAVRHLAGRLASALALKSKRGVTAIEYGLIAALIAVAIIVAVTLVGTNLNATFNMIAGHLGNTPH